MLPQHGLSMCMYVCHSFLWQHFLKIFPNFRPISQYFSDSCHVPWYFHVIADNLSPRAKWRQWGMAWFLISDTAHYATAIEVLSTMRTTSNDRHNTAGNQPASICCECYWLYARCRHNNNSMCSVDCNKQLYKLCVQQLCASSRWNSNVWMLKKI